jgi:hypothetical protein
MERARRGAHGEPASVGILALVWRNRNNDFYEVTDLAIDVVGK